LAQLFITLCISHATLSDQFSVHEVVRLAHLSLHIPSLLIPVTALMKVMCGSVDIPPPRILKLGVRWR